MFLVCSSYKASPYLQRSWFAVRTKPYRIYTVRRRCDGPTRVVFDWPNGCSLAVNVNEREAKKILTWQQGANALDAEKVQTEEVTDRACSLVESLCN